MCDHPSMQDILSHSFIHQEITYFVPNLWRESYYTGLDFSPHNRSSIVSCGLFPVPPLEILLSQHTAPSLALDLISL